MKRLAAVAAAVVLMALPWPSQGQGCMVGDADEEGVQILGFFQPQLEYQSNEGDDDLGFAIKRARIAFTGSIPYDVSYYLCLQFDPKIDDPGVMDAIITYSRLGPVAKISMGQFKAPFSLEQNTPCAGLHTILRSTVVEQLAGPQRDQGLMVWGQYQERISYRLALMNGTGRNVEDNNTGKDIVGRFVVSPLDYLNVGGSFRFGNAPPAAAGVEEDDERTRYGAEAEFTHGNILVQGEYIYGKDVGSYTTGGGCGEALETHVGTVKRSGSFVQGMYMTDRSIQPVLKYEAWDPDLDVDGNFEETITFGVNYFLNDWTRLQVNYLLKREDTAVKNDELLVQAQVRF